MPDLPLPPDALARLGQHMSAERLQDEATGMIGDTSGFGWPPPGAPDAPSRIGRYLINGYAGRGGMGIVWTGHDPDTGTAVAVKVLSVSGPGEADLRKRFAREAEAARRLAHPGIVRILDAGEDAGKPFIVMELLTGAPLDDALAARDVRGRVELLEQVARATGHAHAAGVAHRDLKPANVRLGADGAPRVMDFGLAALEGDVTRLTHTGSVMGTPAWMAPEQVRGEAAGAAADVFALGVMLYQALAGELPFAGANPPQVYDRILHHDPPWPRRRAPGTPPEIEAVCLRALEKEPARRYAHAGEFADELAAWLAGRPVRARLPGTAALLWKRARRNPLAAGGLALAAVSLIAGAVTVGVLSWRHAREQRARDLYRDAQPLAAQAVMALHAGDRHAGERLFSQFLLRVAEARRTDPGFRGGWFEAAEFNRVLGDEGSAWAALESGFRHDPDNPVGRIERGILLSTRYRRDVRRRAAELERAEADRARLEGRAPRRFNPDDVEAAEPALRDLLARARADLDFGVARIGGDPPAARLARAELAAARRDFAEAEALLGALEWAEAKVLRGAIAEARDSLGEAEAWYGKAIATRETAWEAWEARAGVRQRLGEREWEPGSANGERRCMEAAEDWTRLVEAGRSGALTGRASARCDVGRMRIYRQADPTEALEGAVADAEAALAAGEEVVRARAWLGRSLSWLAGWVASRGGDPEAQYVRAAEALAAAAAADPADVELWLELARARRLRGFHRMVRGVEHRTVYDEALEAYGRALALDPNLWHAHSNRGYAYRETGRWREAAAEFEAALRVLGRRDAELEKELEEARRKAGSEGQ